ncbi:S-layer homology domain-containing protein [Leucobacter sp. 7(1)]|uniref:S-layer homology domain-containing protein n=1 Tax=Leucobacter sp. 7(1) TaxID=1255613 RepID=UPI000B35B939|nr:S-layer homology domain-containing protein [Leucobacter sp. 7(1)]
MRRAKGIRHRIVGVLAAAAVVATAAFGALSSPTAASAVTTEAAAPGTIAGHINFPAGVDPTRYQLQIDSQDEKLGLSSSPITANGDFSRDDVPPGNYRVTMKERNGNTDVSVQTLRPTAGPTTFAVAAGQTTNVTFAYAPPTSRISGTIDVQGYDRLVITVYELLEGEWRHKNSQIYDGSGEAPVSYTTPKYTPGTYSLNIYVEDDVLPDEVYNYGSEEPWGDPAPISVGASDLTGINYLIKRSFTAPNPTFSGTPRVGTAFTANIGTWQPAADTLSYEWYRMEGEMGEPVPGATGPSYVPTSADVGKQLQLIVSGSKTDYRKAYRYSTPSAAVTAGALTAPTPTITGTAKVGQTLTAVPGAWGPAPVTLATQWLRDGTAITGATGTTYQSTTADTGKKLSVKVTGTKTGYTTASKTSAATAAVAEADPLNFTATPTPTITGTAKVGETLTVKPGTWTPAPDKLATQWLRDGSAITGATGTTYQATTADTGKKLSVKVTGTKTGYTTASQTSAATAAVAEADPLNFTATPTPTITGTAKVGETLTVKPGTWTPAPDKLATQWLRDGSAITGATGTTYQATTADTGKKLSVKVTGTKTGYTTASKTSAATAAVAKADYVPPKTSPFSDMKPNDKFFKEIAWMFDTGVSTGVSQPDGTRAYQPKVNVTREAMAAFLFRIHAEADYRAPAKSQFTDVKPGDKFYKEISWMYDQGISTGVKQPNGTRTYQPKDGVTREAMAAFMYRLDTGSKPSAPSASPFQDITVGQKFYKEIAWMSTSGLSTGIMQPSGKPIYAPKSNVTREAMAAFLFRADGR